MLLYENTFAKSYDGRSLRYKGGTVKRHALEHEINGILSKKERTDLLDGAHTALTYSGHAA